MSSERRTIASASSAPSITARGRAGILPELGLQPLEQREGIGGRARKAADDVALAEAAHLLGIGLDDGLPDGDLAVAPDGDGPALADGQYGGAVPDIEALGLHGEALCWA